MSNLDLVFALLGLLMVANNSFVGLVFVMFCWLISVHPGALPV